MARKKALARPERKRQIMLAFAVEMENGNDPEMTIAQIARKIDQSVSQKLRQMVTELVIEGVLNDRTETIPGIAKFRRIYSPNPKAFKRPKARYKDQTRTIKINSQQGSFLAKVGLS